MLAWAAMHKTNFSATSLPPQGERPSEGEAGQEKSTTHGHSRGKFIVLEGPDGAGTTKHSELLAERFQKEGHDVVLTAEPTDGAIGEQIRNILHSGVLPSAAALQLLFCADRADHIARVIEPALQAGKTVISDRYALSTVVYGTAQGLDPTWLTSVNAAFPKPDVTFLLLPPFEVCAERINRRKSRDAFEVDTFQKQVYQQYASLKDQALIRIDTSGPKEKVAEEIWGKFKAL